MTYIQSWRCPCKWARASLNCIMKAVSCVLQLEDRETLSWRQKNNWTESYEETWGLQNALDQRQRNQPPPPPPHSPLPSKTLRSSRSDENVADEMQVIGGTIQKSIRKVLFDITNYVHNSKTGFKNNFYSTSAPTSDRKWFWTTVWLFCLNEWQRRYSQPFIQWRVPLLLEQKINSITTVTDQISGGKNSTKMDADYSQPKHKRDNWVFFSQILRALLVPFAGQVSVGTPLQTCNCDTSVVPSMVPQQTPQRVR